ncbi:uncharacterized protein LOC106159046 isoform X2 [Lingula anatina]|uniref:Uncharacterized protein LOC106159046 isoform X2 n=1 Tax=Lingula anatina TaxID=7574 RepID=A0A1S3HYM4_LINAN|nr:uncharacterized protein LOC106159046 isoform X2 [Lingula anatina]|eukprot:XP_013390671.1 uncharacterized protein LOC106159046 isoform X2 [Lingula anatina]
MKISGTVARGPSDKRKYEGSRNACQSIETKLWDILNQSEIPSPVRIMDFGGGDGETMAPIYRKLDALNKQMIISVEEPHEDSLRKYKELIDNTSMTCIDITYSGPFQDYYGHTLEDLRVMNAYPQHLQDRVLALHVLYHLTSIFDDPFDPYENMKQAISAMYTILKPGGQMIIVLEKNEFCLIGAASLKCSEVLFPHKTKNHKLLFEVWQKLLFNGGIADILNESFPMFKASVQQEEVVHNVVLPTLEEIGIAVSIGCLHGLYADQSPFDQRILQFCVDYGKSDGYKHGLYLDSEGMWCFPLNTYYITIQKNTNE